MYNLRGNHLQDEQLHFIVLLLIQGRKFILSGLLLITSMYYLECHVECV